MRRFHRWLGIGSTAVVLLAVVTGLLWAYAPYLYWEDGYMERKHPPIPADFGSVTMSHQDVLRVTDQHFEEQPVTVSEILLRSEDGLAFYEVTGNSGEIPFSLLIDPRAGQVISPLSPELAERIARVYVAGNPPLASITLLPEFIHRKGKIYPSVYRVRFQAEKNPAILLSAASGHILEEEDDVRVFHFWVMRLHQLNFFGFRKTLTIIPGSVLLLLLGSGLWLSRRKRRRNAA